MLTIRLTSVPARARVSVSVSVWVSVAVSACVCVCLSVSVCVCLCLCLVREGGKFRVAVRYNLKDDSARPDVYFITIPYHPNIDAISGKPCLDFLDDEAQWTGRCVKYGMV